MAANGIPTGVNIAPVIPGLNDLEIPNILKEASQIGADYAGHAMLRLPYAVKDLFIDWIVKEFPERSNKILNSIREIRGGKLNSSEWGIRFRGEGELADTIHNLFNISCRKYGLNKRTFHLPTEHFIKAFPQQLELFP
jgi:DNA repair photolyase